MTDNEIIKALEYCVCNLYKCPECPYNNETVSKCSVKLKFDTIDLINRQQAEISVKRKLLEKAEETINKQQAEIERAKEINEQLYEEMSERQKEEVRVAKKYAVLIFADKLKEKYKYHELCGYEVINGELDDLVKEMVGDKQ